MKRFWIENGQGLGQQDLVLTNTEHNHLANVLRLRVGEEIIAVCGDAFEYSYRIERITKTATTLGFLGRAENKFNPEKDLMVYNGVNQVRQFGVGGGEIERDWRNRPCFV